MGQGQSTSPQSTSPPQLTENGTVPDTKQIFQNLFTYRRYIPPTPDQSEHFVDCEVLQNGKRGNIREGDKFDWITVSYNVTGWRNKPIEEKNPENERERYGLNFDDFF